MVGYQYGDFHLRRSWVSPLTKTIELTRNGFTVLNLEVREFNPPMGELDATDTKGPNRNGRYIYAIPWAIANEANAIRSVRNFLDESVDQHVSSILQNDNILVQHVFRMAVKMADNFESVRDKHEIDMAVLELKLVAPGIARRCSSAMDCITIHRWRLEMLR